MFRMIVQKLHDVLVARAARTEIAHLSIGLAYSAAQTADGGMGMAYTMLESLQSCEAVRHLPDFEGQKADRLLRYLLQEETVARGLALALVNALNHAKALELPEDSGSRALCRELGIQAGTRVAMVGHFAPVLAQLEERGAEVAVVDRDRREGHERDLVQRLTDWADALIMSSTTLINGSAESFLESVGPRVRVALLGPSTPMLSHACEGWPVHLLCGLVPTDPEGTLRAIRHGQGTRTFQRYGKKVYLVLG